MALVDELSGTKEDEKASEDVLLVFDCVFTGVPTLTTIYITCQLHTI